MREEAEGRLGALCDRPRADQAWGVVSLSHAERRQPHLRMALEVAVRMARRRRYEKWASGVARLLAALRLRSQIRERRRGLLSLGREVLEFLDLADFDHLAIRGRAT